MAPSETHKSSYLQPPQFQQEPPQQRHTYEPPRPNPGAGWDQPGHPPPAWQAPAQPPPDLLDEPLTLDLPNQSSVAAPPIPPNPEKDALLRQLAQTLHAIRMRSRQQNESSMAGLQAQRTAMLTTIPNFQAEA